MNRFRVNLHPAFFDKNPEISRDSVDQKEQEKKEVIQDSQEKQENLKEEVMRRNNESLASKTKTEEETKEEREQPQEKVDEDLRKRLESLSKNKKIDMPWTDNAWKCSRTEKRLAISSAKVFQELLGKGTLTQMINNCKSKDGELSDQEAEEWKSQLKINSKTKDIQRFYKSFKEYQNPQSEYQHLKNLMGFFCESDFENKDQVRETLRTRSEKITKSDIRDAAAKLYRQETKENEYGRTYTVYVDTRTDEVFEKKPKDWEKRASFEVIKERLEDSSGTNRMLTLLGDFNLDGEVNSGDVGYKTGSQFVDVFRRTVATENLKNKNFNDNTAIKNLVDYVNNFGMDIQGVQTVDQLYQWMTDNKKGYENTMKFQKFLKNLPIELSDVLTNGANAGKQSLDRMVSALNLEEEEKKKALKEAENKAIDIVTNGQPKLKEVIKDAKERANITQQLLTQLPAMLINKAMGEKNGLGIGYGVPLDQIIKGMSAGFNIGIDTDGKPKFGLFIGWDKRFDLSETVGLTTAVSSGVKLGFIPCESASIELDKDVNKGDRDESLDATSEHKVTLGGNVSLVGTIFSWGGSTGFESNKQRGIEKQAENINNVLKKQAKSWVEELKNLQPEDGTREVTFEQKKEALKTILEKEFKNSSSETLEMAANNILSIIQGFKIDEKTTNQDFDIYAQIIADVYSEQWRSAALAGIADDKRKISGGKVGIQFIAGCVPVTTVVVKFTKYRNARTNETEHSHIARLDAQVNGQGNEQISLGDSKEIRSEQVSQINEVLKRYGAKYELMYQGGQNGKPGHILVPASVADEIGINIRVSENMKNYVQNPGIKTLGGPRYQFPANTTYRLLQETGGNQRSLTLNIGSDKSSTSDIMISNVEGMKSLFGNNELISGKKWEYKGDFVGKGSIEYRPDFENLFTPDVVEGLKTVDSSSRRNFSEFMRTKTDGNRSFNDMLNAIINVLGKDQKYKAIVDKLSDSNTLNEDKQLIMDKIMIISADTNVHNKPGLDANVGQRGNRYKESGERALKGPNGQSIFDKLQDIDRDVFINELGGNYDSVPMPDLIGATAFYHNNNKAKGLALTGLGVTTALGGKTKELSPRDSQKADVWFLGGKGENGEYIPGVLDKSSEEWNNVKRAVKEKIPGVNLNDADLRDLLKGKEKQLDNGEKKVKVKIGKEYVFYLMGECANESIGMNLNVSVQEQTQVDVYEEGKLYVNSGDGSSGVSVSRKDFAAGMNFGGKNKKNSVKEAETKMGGGKVVDTTPTVDEYDEYGNPIIPPETPTPTPTPTPTAPEGNGGVDVSGGGRN